jgi:hypothetical protein
VVPPQLLNRLVFQGFARWLASQLIFCPHVGGWREGDDEPVRDRTVSRFLKDPPTRRMRTGAKKRLGNQAQTF